MLMNILVIVLILFALVNFLEGIKIALESPLYLLAGILSIALLYLLSLLPRSNLTRMTIVKGSLIWKVKTNKNLRVPVAGVLLVLSLGNFVYAHWWVGTTVVRGLEYAEAVILSLLAFLLLKRR